MMRVTNMTERSGEHDAAERLAGAGLKRTPRRRRILAVLIQAHRPISRAEVLRTLGDDAPDRVSVYRALEAFVVKGLVHRVYAGGRTWLYETADRCGADHCHPHFTCRSCGEVTCLLKVVVPVVRGLQGGYRAERQRVHITGLCPQCQSSVRARGQAL
jgi:Fur family ferric uptake transcriptional regulator